MKHTFESKIAKWFAMSDEVWQRHANPWSIWTRITVLPVLIIAIWSRAWVGWWSSIPIMVAITWAWFNPRIYTRPKSTNNWASKAVLGERVWLNRKKTPVPIHHNILPNILNWVSGIGLLFVIWGVWQLKLWPTFVGCIFLYAGKLWFLDRMVWVYEDMRNTNPEYASWLYEDNV